MSVPVLIKAMFNYATFNTFIILSLKFLIGCTPRKKPILNHPMKAGHKLNP